MGVISVISVIPPASEISAGKYNSYNTYNIYKSSLLNSFLFALLLILAMFWALKMGEWIESLAGGFEAVKWLYI